MAPLAIHYIGHSSAFTTHNTAYILNPHFIAKRRALVRDGGPNFGANAIANGGYGFPHFATMDHFLLTHQHQDHAGVVEDQGFLNFYALGRRATLYAPKAVMNAVMRGPAQNMLSSIFVRTPSSIELAAQERISAIGVKPYSQTAALCGMLGLKANELTNEGTAMLVEIAKHALGEQHASPELLAKLSAALINVEFGSGAIMAGEDFYQLRRDPVNANTVWAQIPFGHIWQTEITPVGTPYKVADYELSNFQVEHDVPSFGFELFDPASNAWVLDSSDTLANERIIERIESFAKKMRETKKPGAILLDAQQNYGSVHADARIWFSALSQEARSKVVLSHLGGGPSAFERVSKEGEAAGIVGVIGAGDLVVVDEKSPRIIRGVKATDLESALSI